MEEQYDAVLKATLIKFKDNIFLYKISGSEDWKNHFIIQKEKYIHLENSDLIYQVPWYYGKECIICVNDFNNKLFFNINEHLKKASLYTQMGMNYWKVLAEETGDEYWLSQSK